MNGLTYECILCKYKWIKQYIIPCSCGAEVNLSDQHKSIRMAKDGKVGWFQCETCGKYLNKSETETKIIEIPVGQI